MRMKAIVPAAGHGTRFLPVTRVVPKEMLPIGSRPALEVIVDEARDAGADEVVIVISHGKEMIREYFSGDPAIRFVYQEEQRGLGHAVLQAADEVGDGEQPVLILLGDALVAGGSASRELVAVSAAHGGAGVVGLERVPREKVSRYGIVKPKASGAAVGDAFEIDDLVEKPDPAEAPSDLAIAGRYLLNAKIFEHLKTQTPGKGGEIQLTDAIRRMLAEAPLYGCVYSGKRQEIGNPDGYFKALEAFRTWKS